MNHALAIAALAFLAGAGLVVGGIYVLAGPGWAYIAAGAASLLFGIVILRGLYRAE